MSAPTSSPTTPHRPFVSPSANQFHSNIIQSQPTSPHHHSSNHNHNHNNNNINNNISIEQEQHERRIRSVQVSPSSHRNGSSPTYLSQPSSSSDQPFIISTLTLSPSPPTDPTVSVVIEPDGYDIDTMQPNGYRHHDQERQQHNISSIDERIRHSLSDSGSPIHTSSSSRSSPHSQSRVTFSSISPGFRQRGCLSSGGEELKEREITTSTEYDHDDDNNDNDDADHRYEKHKKHKKRHKEARTTPPKTNGYHSSHNSNTNKSLLSLPSPSQSSPSSSSSIRSYSPTTHRRRCTFQQCIFWLMFLWLSLMIIMWIYFFYSSPHYPVVPESAIPSPTPTLQPTTSVNVLAVSSPQSTAHDVTFFTVFTPEPLFVVNDTHGESPIGSPHTDPHRSFLHSMYSWSLLLPNPHQILVYVQELDHCTYMKDLPVEVACRVSACWDAELQAPSLRCILEDANHRALTDLMVYVEDHIVLFSDFIPALTKVSYRLRNFFLVGSSSSLSLTVDPELDLKTWQHDVETAIFLDSSNAKETNHELHAEVDHTHSLHYFAYYREQLDLSTLSPKILMGAGQYYGHHWEKILVSYLLLQDTLNLIDVTRSVTAVEMSHADHTNQTIVINTFNARAAMNTSNIPPISLGRLENTHFVLLGKCPTCTLKENREADLPLILIRQANPQQQIIVLTANSGYLSLAFNWICRAQMLGISNYIMLAEDRIAYRILRKMNVAVVLRKNAPYKKLAALSGSAEFQETLYLRSIFFQQVLDLGFHLIYAHLDTIWFENMLPMFHNTAHECDMHIHVAADGHLRGSLMAVRAGPLGTRFAKDLLSCEQDGWKFIRLHGKNRFFYSDDMDNDCLQYVTSRLVKRKGMKRCPLDTTRYVTEAAFFDRQSSQHQSIFPALVHITDAKGVKNKTRVFLDWDLWEVDAAAMIRTQSLPVGHAHGQVECRAPPPTLPAPTDSSIKYKLIINILASIEYEALQRTLDSLTAAKYDATTKIDLRITVQQPEHDSTSSTKSYIKTAAIARDFIWPHNIGNKKIIFLSSYVGPSAAWLDHWIVPLSATSSRTPSTNGPGIPSPAVDDSIYCCSVFQLALQAGQAVSPSWFIWLKSALAHYYYDPFQSQPNLMAIHLMHQFTIVGESPAARFGSRIPHSILSGQANTQNAPSSGHHFSHRENNNTIQSIFYHYQFIPLFGTVFFPQHFNNFLHWYLRQNHTHNPTDMRGLILSEDVACVPTMISNIWYREDPIKYWWQWLVRFTFETGYYGLYVSYGSSAINPSMPALGLIVDTIPSDSHLSSVVELMPPMQRFFFPSSSSIKLYDLHFNEWAHTADRSTVRLRKYMSAPIPYNSAQTARWIQELPPHATVHDGEDEDEEETEAEEGGRGLWAKLFIQTQQDEKESHIDDMTINTDTSDLSSIEDPTITPTDLVVDLIKTVTSEADEDGDTKKYTIEVQQTAQKIHQLQSLQSLTYRDNIRASHISRCFVIGDRTQDEPIEHAVDVLASLPFPYNMSFTITELYTHIYNTVIAALPSKPGLPINDSHVGFIIYRPKIALPFDRHLRGIYFTFLTALLTQRIFLVDLPEFEAGYNCPWGPDIKWSYTAFKSYLSHPSLISQTVEIDANKINAELRTKWFHDLYREPVLIHNDAVSHDRLLFTNIAYKPYALALFETYSRMRRTGIIMSLLQSKPKNNLIQAVKALQHDVGIPTVKYSICVHIVGSPMKMKSATEEEPLLGVNDEHWNCIKSQLLHLGFVPTDTIIFFTSNSNISSSIPYARQHLKAYGQVVSNMDSFNTNLTNNGICNSTMRASMIRDPYNSNHLLVDPYIINHYLFGECDVTISSGTTYGIFGAARRGFDHRAYLFRGAPPPYRKDGEWIFSNEKDYCGHMHRIDLPSENDITF